MKKIISLLAIFFALFVTTSCGKEETPKEIKVAGREQDFFNISVYYKENKVSWGSGIQQVWVVEISPKSSEYVFNAYNDMEIEITYSCTRQDNGKFEGNNMMWIDVEYDKNGYGYKETGVYGAGNLQNIILLSYEASVSPWEVATKR